MRKVAHQLEHLVETACRAGRAGAELRDPGDTHGWTNWFRRESLQVPRRKLRARFQHGPWRQNQRVAECDGLIEILEVRESASRAKLIETMKGEIKKGDAVRWVKK